MVVGAFLLLLPHPWALVGYKALDSGMKGDSSKMVNQGYRTCSESRVTGHKTAIWTGHNGGPEERTGCCIAAHSPLQHGHLAVRGFWQEIS